MLDEKIQDLIDVLKVQVAQREKDLSGTQGRRSRTGDEMAVHDGLNASYDATISAFDELIDTSKLAIQLRKDMDELKELKATRIRSGATQGLIDNVRGNISQAASGAFGGLLPDAGIRNIITSVLPTLGSAVKAGFTGIMGGDTKTAIEKAELSIKINETSKSILERLKEQLDGLNDKIFSPDSPLVPDDDGILPTDQGDVGPGFSDGLIPTGSGMSDAGGYDGENFVGSGNSDIEIAIGRTMLAVESSSESLKFLVDVVTGMAEALTDYNDDRQTKELSGDVDGVASDSKSEGALDNVLGWVGGFLGGRGIAAIGTGILAWMGGAGLTAISGFLGAIGLPVIALAAVGATVGYFWDDITSFLDGVFDGTGKERNWFTPDFTADGTYAPVGGIAGRLIAEEQLKVAKEQLNLTKEQIDANKSAAEKASQVLKDTIDKWLGRDTDVNQMAVPVNYALMGAVLSGTGGGGGTGGYSAGSAALPSANFDPGGGGGTGGYSAGSAALPSANFDPGGLTLPSGPNPLGDLIATGESGSRGYNAYNKNGKAGQGKAHIDFSQYTLGTVIGMQARGEVFAVGKYQIIPKTMIETMQAMKLSPDERFTPELQERMYRGYLTRGKRPAIEAFISGKSDNIAAAINATAAEWAAVQQTNGRGRYDGDKAGNGATITPKQTAAALWAERNARLGTKSPIALDLSAPALSPSISAVVSAAAVSASNNMTGKSTPAPTPRVGGKPGQPQMTLVPAPYNGNEVFFNLTRAAQVGVGNTPFW